MFSPTLATILVCAVLALIVGGVVYSLIRGKRKGKCACGCQSCAACGECHKK